MKTMSPDERTLAIQKIKAGPLPCPLMVNCSPETRRRIWACVPDTELIPEEGGMTARGLVAMLEAGKTHLPHYKEMFESAIHPILAAAAAYENSKTQKSN